MVEVGLHLYNAVFLLFSDGNQDGKHNADLQFGKSLYVIVSEQCIKVNHMA